MAAKIKFDINHNAIAPTLVLATKGGKKLGAIPAYDINFKNCFSSSSEFSFTVYKADCSPNLWKDIVDFKLLWVREWNKLYEISVELSESSEIIKTITAVTLGESELSQINLYEFEANTEDDLNLNNGIRTIIYSQDANANERSLLNRILEKAPHYSIGNVDSSIARLQRTFSFDEKSIYDSFQEIAEELNCLFVIDCYFDDEGKIQRKVNVYDLESHCLSCNYRGEFTGKCPKCEATNIAQGYGTETPILVSVENLADDITYSVDNDSVKNCFKLVAGDDVMTAAIVNCNPTGSPYLWYLSSSCRKDMSAKLQERLQAYDEKYKDLEENGIALSDDYNGYDALVVQYNELFKTNKFSKIALNSPSNKYNDLLKLIYDAEDFGLFLSHEMMPVSTTSAENEWGILKEKFNPDDDKTKEAVAVLQEITEDLGISIIEKAIEQMAKVYINNQYSVSLSNGAKSPVNNGIIIWTGTVTVSNNYKDADKHSGTVSVEIKKNSLLYIKQLAKRTAGKASSKKSDPSDISSLFDEEDNVFKNALKKYSLSCLKTILDSCKGVCDTLIDEGAASKGDTTDEYKTYQGYQSKLQSISAEITTRESEIATVEKTTSLLKAKKDEIQNSLNLENFFKSTNDNDSATSGEDLFSEFLAFRRDDVYKNENFISDGLSNSELCSRATEFLQTASKEIEKSATAQHSISASLKNLLLMPEFAPIVDNFEVGNWIRIKADGKIYRLRLLDYEVDFNDESKITVTFSDVSNVKDGISDIQSVLNSASSMATSYNYVARQAKQGEESNSILGEWVDNGLDLTNTKIVSDADNQNVMWNEYGLFARRQNPLDGNYDKGQLKIINNGLYLTNDNWKTIKTGIGKYSYIDPETGETVEAYGILADTILGNLILSKNVKIFNEDGSIKMDNDGFKMIVKVNENGTVESKDIFSIDKMFPQKDESGNIVKDESGNVVNQTSSLLSFSDEGNLDITGNLNAGMVGGFVITNEEIKLLDGEKYSVTKIDNKNYYTRDESGNTTISKFFISPNSGRNFRYKFFEIPEIKTGAITIPAIPLYSYINDVKFRLDDTYIGSNGISTSELSAKKIHAGEILAAGKNVSPYMPGDSIEIYNDTPLSAYVSNGRKSIYFSIPLSKSISNNVTAIGLLGVLCGRGITGYLYNYKTRKSEYNLRKAENEGFTVSCEKSGDSFIKVKITFSNQIRTSASDDSAAITNNTPASIMAYKPNSTDTGYTDDDYPLRIIFR